ncbi:PaaI family thioesterase [Crocinitomix catalasitica]|uniref:PaaI family thioesterase n=1 Tax=Crocinitomix catalasitica TaxID=184607 RepID=UPI000907893C|nr:PaaI family thioesterase [Crocinitomix catalasitica]
MSSFRENLIEKYQKSNLFGINQGFELIKFESDEIVYELEVKSKHLATPTTAHGGVIAGYMDAVIGLAALYVSSEEGNLVSTVEFKINFISPVRIGDVLVGIGKVVSKGKRIIVCQGEIRNKKDNTMVAVATGTFNAYPYHKSGMTLI